MELAPRPPSTNDVVCFSHLRWDFVFQRPQHLMTRWAQTCRVFFIEEPKETDDGPAQIKVDPSGVIVITPLLRPGTTREAAIAAQRKVINEVLRTYGARPKVLWYYTPMALLFSRHLLGKTTIVYDCMDELSGFAGAPPELPLLERELMATAHVMFTGGHSLYRLKRKHHYNAHPFPSSVDVAHFGKARLATAAPPDLAKIPRPRVGYHGVIDERINLDLIRDLARLRPDWHLILVGPVVKIDPQTLPQAPNIHYLGPKSYAELPSYLSGWHAAMLPFALNKATQYISPTKTPEYLAGGKPVVSTPIEDVVHPYGDERLVTIADDAAGFARGLDACTTGVDSKWLTRVDRFLSGVSWERTFSQMKGLVNTSGPQSQSQAAPMMRSFRHGL